MKSYTVENATSQLVTLVNDALQGETVVIRNANGLEVLLVPNEKVTLKPLKAGSARGKFKMADDFDAPLPEFAPYTE